MSRIDGKSWEEAYRQYRRRPGSDKSLTFEAWKVKILGKYAPAKLKKKASKKHGSLRDVYDKEAWVTTQREYLRWRKTPEFRKWQRNQFLKQGGTCYYCDSPIYGGVRQNVDHVIPKIRRGDNRHSNLVLACADCNKKKNYDLLPYKERQALKKKNRAKRGTYLKTRGYIQTEADVIEHVRNIAG